MIEKGHFRCLLRQGLLAIFLVLPGLAAALETSLTAPGAPEALQKRLAAASAVLSAEQRKLTTPQELLAAALSDYRTLIEVLYDAGYFSPVVNIRVDGREAASIPPLDPPARIGRIAITVTAGPPFRFGRATIGPLTPATEIPKGYAPGQPATTAVIRDAARAGIDGWRQSGYAKATVGDQRITANHRTAQIDSDIRLLPGRKLRFGRLVITADSRTRVREEAIRRIAGFPSGGDFDPDDVQKVAARLRRTGAFGSVTLREHEAPNPDGTLDFDATVIDAKRRRISAGAEIDSDQGLALTFLWMHRNLFDGAEGFRFDAQIRDIGSGNSLDGTLAVRLDRPAVFGPDHDMFYQFVIDKRDEKYYNSLRAIASIGAKRIYSDRLYAELSLGVGTSKATDAYSVAAGADYRRFYMAGLMGHVEWDRRDNKVSATRGFFLDARVTPFVGFKGTDNGVHALVDGRAYYSVTDSGSIVLAGRTLIGSLMGASLQGVPPEYLFFSGGAGTVRGQPYQSLGALTIPTGTVGGKSLLALSGEVRGRVSDRISLVGFFDWGSVGTGVFVDSASPSQSGAGLGLRYDIGGIGPIRFDIAYPVSGTTGSGLQFYIGIGQAF